jgi:hypothetical membrane protein
MPRTTTSPKHGAAAKRSLAGGAAAVWLASGVGYLILEGVAAAGFRYHYNYAHNYISDLGVTSRGTFQGRTIDSPLAYLMNTAFYLQGTSFLIGAVLVVRAAESRKAGLFLVLAAANAIGNILVGAVHSGPMAKVDGTAWLHHLGAALAIGGGNIAIFAGSAIVRNMGAGQRYRRISVGIGVLGLLSAMMLVIDSATGATRLLPEGVWERGSVYSIIVWQMCTAAYLMRVALRR